MTQSLNVFLNNTLIGELRQQAGRMEFQYDRSAAQAISLSLPLRTESYSHDQCFPYFDGLLPEGEYLRQSIARRFGANARNSFSMLRAIGRDCAGAVSFHERRRPVFDNPVEAIEYRIVSDEELATYIHELPQRPLFAGIDGIRLSLAGAQEKAAVCLVNGQIALPQSEAPTTHILKPLITGVADSVYNEFLCLRIANKLNIKTPRLTLGRAKNQPYLLIERYDRKPIGETHVIRLHQEDFCQALGVPSAAKYQADGGPAFAQCFDLLKKTTVPALNINQMMERVVFNFLIGNRDAHAKNFSLLYTPDLSLAPAYDIMCTEVYKDVNKKMAMKIGGDYRPSFILPRHWERLCSEVNFNFRTLKGIINRQTAELPKFVESEISDMRSAGHEFSLMDQVQEFVDKNCATTRKRFELALL